MSAKHSDPFWDKLDRLLAESKLVIDRPVGTRHPRYTDFVYPYDYGYLDGTSSGDGGGIDVWIGSEPDRKITAVIASVDMDKRDAEVKLLVVCSYEDARRILAWYNTTVHGGVLIERSFPF